MKRAVHALALLVVLTIVSGCASGTGKEAATTEDDKGNNAAMTEDDKGNNALDQYRERWMALEKERTRALAAPDSDALLRTFEESSNLMRQALEADAPEVRRRKLTVMREARDRMRTEFEVARKGEVVATASFDPGIAPFTIEVRRVPVPVTNSKHFIISLYRGEYVVTSFRYFWLGYTPERVRISWPCVNQFTVSFDDKYEATCDWRWGAGASWSMTIPDGAEKPGLSPYYFTPRNPPPPGCSGIVSD
jgi:hypothetical protein